MFKHKEKNTKIKTLSTCSLVRTDVSKEKTFSPVTPCHFYPTTKLQYKNHSTKQTTTKKMSTVVTTGLHTRRTFSSKKPKIVLSDDEEDYEPITKKLVPSLPMMNKVRVTAQIKDEDFESISDSSPQSSRPKLEQYSPVSESEHELAPLDSVMSEQENAFQNAVDYFSQTETSELPQQEVIIIDSFPIKSTAEIDSSAPSYILEKDIQMILDENKMTLEDVYKYPEPETPLVEQEEVMSHIQYFVGLIDDLSQSVKEQMIGTTFTGIPLVIKPSLNKQNGGSAGVLPTESKICKNSYWSTSGNTLYKEAFKERFKEDRKKKAPPSNTEEKLEKQREKLNQRHDFIQQKKINLTPEWMVKLETQALNALKWNWLNSLLSIDALCDKITLAQHTMNEIVAISTINPNCIENQPITEDDDEYIKSLKTEFQTSKMLNQKLYDECRLKIMTNNWAIQQLNIYRENIAPKIQKHIETLQKHKIKVRSPNFELAYKEHFLIFGSGVEKKKRKYRAYTSPKTSQEVNQTFSGSENEETPSPTPKKRSPSKKSSKPILKNEDDSDFDHLLSKVEIKKEEEANLVTLYSDQKVSMFDSDTDAESHTYYAELYSASENEGN